MSYIAFEISSLILDGSWVSRQTLLDLQSRFRDKGLDIRFFVLSKFEPDFRTPVVEQLHVSTFRNALWDAKAVLWSLTDLEVYLDRNE